jgi:hypothetical protein
MGPYLVPQNVKHCWCISGRGVADVVFGVGAERRLELTVCR